MSKLSDYIDIIADFLNMPNSINLFDVCGKDNNKSIENCYIRQVNIVKKFNRNSFDSLRSKFQLI